jgi:hypothetical protein
MALQRWTGRPGSCWHSSEAEAVQMAQLSPLNAIS